MRKQDIGTGDGYTILTKDGTCHTNYWGNVGCALATDGTRLWQLGIEQTWGQFVWEWDPISTARPHIYRLIFR